MLVYIFYKYIHFIENKYQHIENTQILTKIFTVHTNNTTMQTFGPIQESNQIPQPVPPRQSKVRWYSNIKRIKTNVMGHR